MQPNTTAPPEFATRIAVADARVRLREVCAPRRLPAETIALEHALGRILAADASVPHDVPGFANSAMDGYALRAADLPAHGERVLRLAGSVHAGAVSAPACGEGECVRIMTGAPLPVGADSVVIQENVHVDGDAVRIRAGERAGANVRPAGEDYQRGEVAVYGGTRLSAAQLGVLASCGYAEVAVGRLPRVALFVTGDELVPPSRPLGYGQIHDSNRYSLGGLLRQLGIVPDPLVHLRDDPAVIRAALRDAGERCDVIVSSGGVSSGDADFLPRLITELGKVHFWKVRMKPGMPILFGEVGRALAFALPGNPVSTMATFLLFVRPALLALQGSIAGAKGPSTLRARLAEPLSKRHDRTEYLRASLASREDGSLWVSVLPKQGSGMLRGVAEADALVVVPEDARGFAAGDVVDVIGLPD